MKIVYYVGLVIFIVGIFLFFLRQFNESLLPGINSRLIDMMWPIGLLIYGFAQIAMKKSKKES